MKAMLLTAGIVIILASVCLRAARKLTVDLAAFWGIWGMLLLIAGAVFFSSAGAMEKMTAGESVFLAFGVILSAAGFMISIPISGVIVGKQEQVLELSLLLKESGKKRLLFVINTMGRAGAETALLELLKELDGAEYDIFLYVLMGQGEMLRKLPPHVKVLNQPYSYLSVLTREGRRRMAGTVFKAFWNNGGWHRKLGGMLKSLRGMAGNRRFELSKLFWRTLSDGAVRFETEFDLAAAWLEGGSAYYVADHVRARRKAAFIHTDYENAGYTRDMDRACWEQYERIFAVSGKVKEGFQRFYPEYADKVSIFYNHIDQEAIRRRAQEPGGFTDAYDGIRILSVGRLAYPKAYDVSAESMRLVKESGYRARWYVLGEGDQRGHLEKKIASLGLKEDFLLLGEAENPYPYYAQADIYVQASRFEGRSIAVLEAQTLGCAVIAADCGGNREEIADGRDGILCASDPAGISDSIIRLLEDEEKRKELGRTAEAKKMPQDQVQIFRELLE